MNVPSVRLGAGLDVCRIINGMWQVSGTHGSINPSAAVAEMVQYYDVGLSSFDMADIYGPAEQIYGSFISKLQRDRGVGALQRVQGLTKFVPRPGEMSRQVVESAIRKSMSRMQVPSLDCVQFHWWDYSDLRYLDALHHLTDLKKEGFLGEISVTNFNTEVLQNIVAHGIPVVSNQVQYSIIDMRPAARMADFCQKHNIKLLTYGTLCGGLCSEKYLGAKEPKGRADLNTASLNKYKQMIDAWGGWSLFQELLQVLNAIAKQHNVSIANIVTRYVLDQPAVASVIIGCRFGVPGAEHIQDNLRTFQLNLTDSDKLNIQQVLRKSNNLMTVIGDCGDEYR